MNVAIGQQETEIVGTSSFDVFVDKHVYTYPRINTSSTPDEITINEQDFFYDTTTKTVRLKNPESFIPSRRVTVTLKNNTFQEKETAKVNPTVGFVRTDKNYSFNSWAANSFAQNVIDTMTELFGDTVSTTETRNRFINKLLPLDWETTTEPVPQNNPNFVLKDVDFSGIALTESRFRANSGLLYRGGALISPRDYIESGHWDWAPARISGRRTPSHSPETQLFWFLDKNNQIHERHVVAVSSVGALIRTSVGAGLGFPEDLLYTAKVENVGDPIQWPVDFPTSWSTERRLNWSQNTSKGCGYRWNSIDLKLITFDRDLPPDVIPFKVPDDNFILHTEALNAASVPRNNVLPTVFWLPQQTIRVADMLNINTSGTSVTNTNSIFPVMSTYFVTTTATNGHSGSPSVIIYKDEEEYKTILLGLYRTLGGSVNARNTWGMILPFIRDAMQRNGSPHYETYPQFADLSMFTPAEDYIEWS